ncbi:vacuolar protein sorting-associated protein 13D-like isoform X2 [Coregonus clupeaformis]|uniref:vacuolar protein sorting-associated protein 13D-like isoform X2 n=1 Tax=Coregonus clupeaformis TaxID=59861 RepID=UPI001E1C90B6|nr:vacuolar protein sorting-associated protein 13D-like isoform X2 [Coregonus clupeaformis]
MADPAHVITTHLSAPSGTSFNTTGIIGGGLISVITSTVEGVKTEGGVSGFFSGLGKGLVGTVTKPVARALDFASETAQTVRDMSSLSNHRLIVLRVRKPRCCKVPQGLLPRFSSTQGLLPHFSSTQGLLPRFSSTQGLLPHFSSTQGLLPHFSSTQGLLPRFSSTQGLLPRFSSTQGLLPRFSSTQGLLPRFSSTQGLLPRFSSTQGLLPHFSSTQADGQEQLFHLTDNIHSEFFIAVEPIDTHCVLISSKVVYFLKPCEFVDRNAIFLEVKYDDLNHFLVSKDHGKVYVQLTKKAEHQQWRSHARPSQQKPMSENLAVKISGPPPGGKGR